MSTIKKKTIAFITGATGFVGSHLARRLVERDYEVHILIRKSSNTFRITDMLPHLHTHYGDITEKEKLTEIIRKIRPTSIFHLANVGIYGGVEGEVNDVISVNLIGTINLIDACSNVNYKAFINTGSSSEYGPKSKTMNEEDPTFPQSLYAITKLAGTNYALKVALHEKKPLTTLRLFSPFGTFDEKQRLVPYVIHQMLQNKEVLLQSKKAVRDYVFVDDVVDAYIAAEKHIVQASGKVINIGTGKQLTVEEVVVAIKKVTHSKSKIIWGKHAMRRFESDIWRASITRAKNLLHWRPQHSFLEGVQETTSWYLANNSKKK